MKLSIESVLRSIEVARTKLRLLPEYNSNTSTFASAEKLLTDAQAVLKNSGDISDDIVDDILTLTNPVSINGATPDFTRIKNIDSALAVKLGKEGVKSFEEIAAWGADDIAKVTTALSLGPRISRENWIEQAAILAQGIDTIYSRTLPKTPNASDLSKADSTQAGAIRNGPALNSSGDQRAAPIEIASRADNQSAYPNSEEDSNEVVKRFMDALTGNNDKK